MSLAFTDPNRRLQRILTSALESCLLDTIVEEPERRIVINAHRAEGQVVGVRFFGIEKFDATVEPEPNSLIKIRGVGTGGGLSLFLRHFLPWKQQSIPLGSRVRIEAGGAQLTIDCQDAEWWQEDEAPPGR